MKLFIQFFLFAILFTVGTSSTAQRAKKIKKEDIREMCKGLSLEERPRITVSQFKIEARQARNRFGLELAAMLTNALSSTGCFDVPESVSELDDEMADIAFNLSGATDGSGAVTGKMLGSQLMITGSITEFKNNTVQILGVGSEKAHIGIVLKVVDIQTRQIIYSGSFEGKSVKPQLQVLGTDIVALGSAAMEDAAEKIIIQATYDVAKNKQLFAKYKGATNAIAANDTECDMARGSGQSVMVIIPEIHISRKVPDPAGETQIIKRLLQAGFEVVDPTIYASIRNSQRLSAAVKDPSKMAQIGQEFGADIIIFGEAFSEADGRKNGMFSCRARVEARAVNTKTGRILAADGSHAGGLDNTELVAGKTALRNAGNTLANYFIESLCSSLETLTINDGGAMAHSSEVLLANESFSTLVKIEKHLKQYNGVESIKKSMSGSNATIQVNHTCSLDELADELMSGRSGVIAEITGFDSNSISAEIK